jgi:hypothetical protein
MPHLTDSFMASDAFKKLSAGARAALLGLLEFAIPRSAEWTVDGSPSQVAAWVGDESGLGRKAVQDGLTELEAARLLKRSRPGTQGSGYLIMAPLAE